eukprot:3168714-Alexandrium_andersonii.AAC.1
MSASLMGSEMCIRDSTQACAKCKRATQQSSEGFQRCPKRFALLPEPSGGWNGVQKRPCLLYTSDAADDM